MTTSPEWRKVEQQLDHLTSELLRLQQQKYPWLMTVQEQSDLIHTMQTALQALEKDMEPPALEELPPVCARIGCKRKATHFFNDRAYCRYHGRGKTPAHTR